MNTKVEMQQAADLFPSLRDKCAVRLVSRLNVAREQTRVQQENEGFLSEMVGLFTGEAGRRQNQINSALTDVAEQTVEDLSIVMESLAINSRTLGLVHSELRNIQQHTKVIGLEVLDLKDRVAALDAQVTKRFSKLTAAIEQVDFRVRAAHHLERVILRWKGGELSGLPVLLCCYSVFENLWWGDFGFFIQNFPGKDADQLLSDLQFRIANSLAETVNVPTSQRLSRDEWLIGAQEVTPCIEHSVTWLADWAEPATTPYVSLLCQNQPEKSEFLVVPHLFSAERLGREFKREFFVERAIA